MKSTTLTILFAIAFLFGCKPASNLPATVPAEGVVTLDGQAVDKAAVTFIAETGNYHATALTDASGKFALKAFDEKPGAVPGSYKVEVSKTLVTQGESSGGEGTVNVQQGLPIKYATITTSGLAETIPEAGNTNIKIDLHSK